MVTSLTSGSIPSSHPLIRLEFIFTMEMHFSVFVLKNITLLTQITKTNMLCMTTIDLLGKCPPWRGKQLSWWKGCLLWHKLLYCLQALLRSGVHIQRDTRFSYSVFENGPRKNVEWYISSYQVDLVYDFYENWVSVQKVFAITQRCLYFKRRGFYTNSFKVPESPRIFWNGSFWLCDRFKNECFPDGSEHVTKSQLQAFCCK